MNDLTLYESIPERCFPIIFHDHHKMPVDFTPHWHEHTEMHFIFKGTPIMRCADEIVQLSKFDCIIINGNELHQGLGGGICDSVCMVLPPSFFDNTLAVFRRKAHDDTITELFTKLLECLRAQNDVYNYELKGYTNLLIAHLIRNYTNEMLPKNLYFSRMQKLEKINKSLQFIEENFTEKITTDMLAKKAHLSEGHFCSIFKEATGMTAKEYINDLRIKKASALISTTDISITDAAMCSGFSDANYFARIFKKTTGKTPYSLKKDK